MGAVCQALHKERPNKVIQSTLVQSGVTCTKHSNRTSGRAVGTSLAPGTNARKKARHSLTRHLQHHFVPQEYVCIPGTPPTWPERTTDTSSGTSLYPPCSSPSSRSPPLRHCRTCRRLRGPATYYPTQQHRGQSVATP